MIIWNWFHNILISLDQLLNTVTGGKPDETVSSRLGKARRNGSKLAGIACAVIEVFDTDHCLTSIEEDE